MIKKRHLLLATAMFAVSLPALSVRAAAQQAPADGSTSEPPATAPGSLANDTNAAAETTTAPDGYHDNPDDAIIVTGAFQRNRNDVLSGTSVLTGDALIREVRPTIGETLARQPGVSATSFGPNASRPVLRGFQGERVRVLTDGIGSFDVSNTSVDHAVAINPLTADRIEVLRGPSALLFGSSAIGGVVNVIDSRIPRRVPDEPVHVEATATYGSAANERSASSAVDVPLSNQFVVHFDGSYSKTGNLDTGGYILTPDLRRQAAASADPDIAALADLRGKLPNSAARNWEVAGGFAVINEGGNIGISVNHIDNVYGVPIRYSLDPDVEAEAVRLAVKQTRADVRAEINADGNLIDKIKFRAGYADYKHNEIDENGNIGTTFLNNSFESRLEIVQANRGGWEGAVGGQFLLRDFNVIGDEKFLPQNNTQQFGLFTLQSVDFGKVKAEAGARYEYSVLNARADADLGNGPIRRTFNSYSGSLGASYALTPDIRIGISGSHTERAPSAEELFPNGPHAGTQAFEIGNPDFTKEKSWGLEGSLRGDIGAANFSLSGFYSWFNNYIYDVQTGAIQDNLPVFQFQQADAHYYGFEAEASATLARLGNYDLKANGVADYVRATINSVGPVPRIPPLRLLGGIEAASDALTARVEAEYSTKQDRVSPLETPTDSFTLVNASLTFKPFGAGTNATLIASANNIFDVVARRHASFLKDYAPLPGRDIRLTARVSF